MLNRNMDAAKVAFLFLTVGQVRHEHVWAKYFAGNESKRSVYVHSKNDFPKTSLLFPFLIAERVDTSWTNTMVAQVALLKAALADKANQKFVFLSESTIPLSTLDEAYSHFMSHTKSEFSIFANPHGTSRMRSRKQELLKTVGKLYKNSQWIVLNREHAQLMVDDQVVLPLFSDFMCDNEHYPSTFLYKHRDRVVSNSVTLDIWNEGGPHPHEFQSLDSDRYAVRVFDAIRSGAFLFARKFSVSCNLAPLHALLPTLY